ncbi:hypothetical protein [Pantoea brenneri]|uniref:hypothetical protein n=1 Tax=Pantoea brenneri TaxID=472694 RepID=UPI002898116A|nr:hypothetical protein [Pantoea brenneri]
MPSRNLFRRARGCRASSGLLARRRHQTQWMNQAIIREQQVIADRCYAPGLLNRARNVRDSVWQQ